MNRYLENRTLLCPVCWYRRCELKIKLERTSAVVSSVETKAVYQTFLGFLFCFKYSYSNLYISFCLFVVYLFLFRLFIIQLHRIESQHLQCQPLLGKVVYYETLCCLSVSTVSTPTYYSLYMVNKHYMRLHNLLY